MAALVLQIVWMLQEARGAQPIMPLHLFTSRERASTYVARLIRHGAIVGFFYFTTQYLPEVLGFIPGDSGPRWHDGVPTFAKQPGR